MNLRHQVFELLKSEDRWWSLAELQAATGSPAPDAYVRDLRKPKFGGFRIAWRKEGRAYRLDRSYLWPERELLVYKPARRWYGDPVPDHAALKAALRRVEMARQDRRRNPRALEDCRHEVLSMLVRDGFLTRASVQAWLVERAPWVKAPPEEPGSGAETPQASP